MQSRKLKAVVCRFHRMPAAAALGPRTCRQQINRGQVVEEGNPYSNAHQLLDADGSTSRNKSLVPR